jgi:hypothetical protein
MPTNSGATVITDNARRPSDLSRCPCIYGVHTGSTHRTASPPCISAPLQERNSFKARIDRVIATVCSAVPASIMFMAAADDSSPIKTHSSNVILETILAPIYRGSLGSLGTYCFLRPRCELRGRRVLRFDGAIASLPAALCESERPARQCKWRGACRIQHQSTSAKRGTRLNNPASRWTGTICSAYREQWRKLCYRHDRQQQSSSSQESGYSRVVAANYSFLRCTG